MTTTSFIASGLTPLGPFSIPPRSLSNLVESPLEQDVPKEHPGPAHDGHQASGHLGHEPYSRSRFAPTAHPHENRAHLGSFWGTVRTQDNKDSVKDRKVNKGPAFTMYARAIK